MSGQLTVRRASIALRRSHEIPIPHATPSKDIGQIFDDMRRRMDLRRAAFRVIVRHGAAQPRVWLAESLEDE